MRVLITGGAGLVAGYLVEDRPTRVDVELTWRHRRPAPGTPVHRVDLTDETEVGKLFERTAPDVVVHTAYTMGSRADIVVAAAHVARASARSGAGLVHLSSDVVFSGERAPYAEGDPLEPVNDYGRWKAEAEGVVTSEVPDACITRTSLVVSLEPPDRGTRWLVESVRSGATPTLFHDEIRSPIRAADLARVLWSLVGLERAERAGIWHLPGPEALSRLELGRRVLAAAGFDPSLARAGSVRDHPDLRARDTTLVSRRIVPGAPPAAVP